MQALGYQRVVLTPHYNPEIYEYNSPQRLRRLYDSFLADMPADIHLKLSLAAEHMVIENFENARPQDLLFYDDDFAAAIPLGTAGTQTPLPPKSILIEMSYFFKSVNIEDTIFKLVLAGFNPILAHPERYTYMANERGLRHLEHYHDMGCRFQMNLLSLSGVYGKGSLYILHHLWEKHLYNYIVSDLHTLRQLKNIEKIAYKPLAKG